jgi:hypothetical protein
MADEIRSRADLIALLPDNSIGAIDEQAIRDIVASMYADYGGMHIRGGVTPQVVSATPQKMVNWLSNAVSLGVVPDFTTGEITVATDGVYEGQGMFMFTGTANKTYYMALYVDTGSGYVDPGAPRIFRKLGTGADVGSAGMTTQALLSAGDKVAAYVWSPDGGVSITFNEANFSLKRIG